MTWQNQESGIVNKRKLIIAQKIDKTKGVSKVTHVKYFQNDISLIHTASAYFIDEEMHLYPMIFKQQTSTQRTLPLHIVDVVLLFQYKTN